VFPVNRIGFLASTLDSVFRIRDPLREFDVLEIFPIVLLTFLHFPEICSLSGLLLSHDLRHSPIGDRVFPYAFSPGFCGFLMFEKLPRAFTFVACFEKNCFNK
jgi:hypothetical protein